MEMTFTASLPGELRHHDGHRRVSARDRNQLTCWHTGLCEQVPCRNEIEELSTLLDGKLPAAGSAFNRDGGIFRPTVVVAMQPGFRLDVSIGPGLFQQHPGVITANLSREPGFLGSGTGSR